MQTDHDTGRPAAFSGSLLQTVTQYHNQKIDSDNICPLDSDFTNFTQIHLCVY